MATQVFGIREGAISGPISSEGQFGVAKMQKKCPPTFQDPQILALAENTLIQEGLNRAIKKVISWLYEQA